MNNFFAKLFTRYPKESQRMLEMMPGLTVYALIFLPLYGSFLFPEMLAYFILFFDSYWFFKSFHLVYTTYVAQKKIKEAEKENWLEKAADLEHFANMTHVL